MAIQEWIAMRKDLARDPAVIRIAAKLKVRTEVVVGYLHRVWGWLDEQSEDGYVHGITIDAVEEVLSLPNFLHLMCEVGWLEYENQMIHVPKWERWMGSSAKKRLQDARRKQLTRTDKKRTNVHKRADVLRTSSSSSSSSKSKKKVFVKPTVDDVSGYCQERGNSVDPQAFVDHYESNGWKVGRNSMKDWKAAVRKWERSDFGGGQTKEQRAIEERKRHLAAERSRIDAEEDRRRLSRQADRSGLDASEAFNASLNEIERGL